MSETCPILTLAHLTPELIAAPREQSDAYRCRAGRPIPFVELKIDRSFVTDCGTDRVNAGLCKTVIDLAHNFGSVAVAIGIEKASDVLAVTGMGCDLGQGYLLGQPMPEERFVSLLRQRGAGKSGPIPAPATARPFIM
jgi:predicted signal transduction protein with EAL and GGDEF domain